MTKTVSLAALALALSAGSALAEAHAACAEGLTLEDGTLTIATGNPAYYPWVMDDTPESGEGFEAAVAYAIAAEMGFEAENVTWVRSSFDEAIQPGAKNFDFNLQQYSITPEREEIVDFSVPYYTAPMAVLLAPGVESEATMEALQGLKWGAVGSTTAVPMLTDVIQPEQDLLLYGDNADVNAAMGAGQIDAALFDLPTAMFLSAVMIEGSTVLGQFAAEGEGDQFGLLFEDGNELKACADAAIAALEESGELAAIEAEWLQSATGIPLIE